MLKPRHHATGTGRNEPPDDDVLLQSVQGVDLAADSGFGQHAGGFLEGCRRDERAGLQRGLGDAQQNRLAFSLLQAFELGLCVDFLELDEIKLFALDQRGLAAILDFDLLEHLTNDNLDVLIVNLHALQTVDVLDFVHEVGCQCLDALDAQDVVRRGVAVHDVVAAFHEVALAC